MIVALDSTLTNRSDVPDYPLNISLSLFILDPPLRNSGSLSSLYNIIAQTVYSVKQSAVKQL